MPPPSRDVRRERFARFVERALTTARRRGLTIADIERMTGVSKATIYRWRSGGWTSDPRGSQVRAFCEGLDLPPKTAYDLLGWSNAVTASVEPPPMDPDVEIVLRALADPHVPEMEKLAIHEILKMIAAQQRRRRREAS